MSVSLLHILRIIHLFIYFYWGISVKRSRNCSSLFKQPVSFRSEMNTSPRLEMNTSPGVNVIEANVLDHHPKFERWLERRCLRR